MCTVADATRLAHRGRSCSPRDRTSPVNPGRSRSDDGNARGGGCHVRGAAATEKPKLLVVRLRRREAYPPSDARPTLPRAIRMLLMLGIIPAVPEMRAGWPRTGATWCGATAEPHSRNVFRAPWRAYTARYHAPPPGIAIHTHLKSESNSP